MNNAENILGRKEDVKAILAALGIKKRDKPNPSDSFFSPRKIIEASVDNRAKKTQKDWIQYFNSRNEAMISMPDLYHAGKSNNINLLAALQEDLKSWEVTSTRLIYQPDNLNGKVVHYFGSTVVEPVETELIIPDYNSGKLIKKVLYDPLGLAFLQAIFGTEDDKEAILETLIMLSGKKEGNIKVWTPNQEDRKDVPERRLVCGSNDDFLVDCYLIIDYGGCSCVVQK